MNKPAVVAAPGEVCTTFKLMHGYLKQVFSISNCFASKYSRHYSGHTLCMVLWILPVVAAARISSERQAKIMKLQERPSAVFISASVTTQWEKCQSCADISTQHHPPPCPPISQLSRWCDVHWALSVGSNDMKRQHISLSLSFFSCKFLLSVRLLIFFLSIYSPRKENSQISVYISTDSPWQQWDQKEC